MKQGNHSTEPLPIRTNMIWNSAGSIIDLGCTWLLTVFVVRLSGDYEAAGVLALAMVIYNMFNPLAEYRMYTYQISDTQHQSSTGEYLTFRIITSTAAFACTAVYSLFTCALSELAPVLLFFIYRISGNLLLAFHGTMVLNSRMDYSGMSCALQGVFSLAAFVGVFGATQSLEASFIVMTLITIAIGILYTYPRTIIFETIKLGISKEKALNLALVCLPIVIASIICAACPAIPRQYLAATQGEALLGAYASVAAPAAIIQMGASYIYNPLMSSFARSYHAGEKNELVSLLAKAAIGIALVGVIAGLLLALAGEWLLVLLFGQSISGYVDFLVPAIVMTAVTGFLWFFNDVLVSLRKLRSSAAGNAVALVIVLLLTIPLVNTFGANGVSFTVTAAYAVGAIVSAGLTVLAIRKL